MSTANEKLQDLQTKNQHLIEEHKNDAVATALLFFKRMEKQIQKLITVEYDEETFYQKDKNALKKKIKEIQETELNKLKDRLIKDAEKVLGVEADVYKSQLDKVFSDFDEIKIKSVDKAQLKKDFEKSRIALEKGAIYTLTAFWNTFYDSVRGKIIQNIESAYTYGKSTRDFLDDLNTGFKINENQLDAVGRTLIQQAYIIALIAMNKNNDGLIRGYLWNSVMDSHTSPFCVDHSQQFWLYDFPEKSTLPYEIYSPAHYKCRTSNPPITKSYTELGLNPDSLSDADKEYLSGAIPDKQSYYQWFNNQSASLQKKILGPTRYNAFSQGNIKIDQYYNNGRKLTIKELERKGLEI